MILFSERQILIMIAQGKELPAIASELHHSLDFVYHSIHNIERKTLTKTWNDLVELGNSFLPGHRLPEWNIIDYYDYE